jgi:catechol 2,3-dioxygenase-like lactoylglutathione lyase family enzyme
MRKTLKTALALAALLTAPGLAAAAQTPAPVQPHFMQNSMNVYRRFPVEARDKMVAFYDQVLGLKPLRPIQLSANQQMILFGIGSGQIKLAAGLKEDRQYHIGGVNEVIGIRLFTLYFPDEAALTARFQAAGYPAPAFKDIGGGRRAALVQDPAGFNLELVALPNAPAETYGRVDVGINVADLKRSEAFYRDFAGLDELPPVTDPLLGVTKHPFRHGETTIDLWSVGKGLPADTGSAGIQYVTNNVEAIDANAKAQHIVVETPLGGVAGFNVLTVWLNDPDGVTNYFYQFAPRPAQPAVAAQ